jgi:6-phosphogluconolactonase
MANSPELWGDVHVAESLDLLYDHMALALVSTAMRAVSQRGVFHIALSGGSTPEPFYMRLVTDPRFRGLPWQVTHLWIVDERRVPLTDAKSNFLMIRESLSDHVPIKKRALHAVPVDATDPAAAYEEEMRAVFTGNSSPGPASFPRLDWVLLGMGDDGHTASLFPGSDAQLEESKWIVKNEGPKVTPPARVTMTYPLINAAREIAVLVTGAKKAPMISKVDAARKNGGDKRELPILGIDPETLGPGDGTMTWFLDRPAAGK